MKLPTWPQLKTLLLNHYSAPLSVIFKWFRLGAALFFCGGVMIWIALNNLPASVAQEWLLLAGLLLGGTGFIIAMLAQMRHIISRLVRYWLE